MVERPRARVRGARAAVLFAAVAVVALTWPAVAAADNSPGQGSITGRVTDQFGNPVGPESAMCALVGSSSEISSNLHADGTYRIDGINAGAYAVRFVRCPSFVEPSIHYAEEFYPNLHDPAAADSPALPNVQVVDGQVTTGIDAQLEVGGQLTVSTVDTGGTPRGGLCVAAQEKRDYGWRWNVGKLAPAFYGTTASNGRVTLVGMPPGDYYVVVRSCDWATVSDPDLTRVQFSGGVFDAEHATTTRVEVGQVASTSVVMSQGATITGTITHGGVPEAGACAIWSSRRQDEGMSAVTDAQGHYTIRGITPTVPGVVRACDSAAHATEDRSAPTWYPSAASRWTAGDVTLAAGSSRTIDFALQPRATVSMIVTGVPQPSACQVVVTDGDYRVQRVDLRPSAQTGVYVADAFGLAGFARTPTLECGGRRAGVGRVADERTPLFETGWSENDSWNSPVVQIAYDVSGPSIVPSPNPATMDWSKEPVTVRFTCSDAVVEVSQCPSPVRLGEGQSTTVWAADSDGNVSSLWVMPRVDATPPTITVTGNGRTFKGDEPMQFACDATDDRSGIAWVANACPAWGTPASTLGVGTHTYQVTTSDWAGNTFWTTATVIVK